ncbi:YkoP family protein [Fervidibacillus albus]|uniref:YkoP-like domain-containing protein n=1 Tax=Fervidibacillus albus TaxID=2980026 RepID=A0A9E8LWK5_9BACI|nr:hypothetical protein [Fervidibacillus albus]WAA11033.1 hypothetical protein OE104_06935 [Fervidibacillus albus]
MRKFIFMFWKTIDPIYFFFTRLTYIHRGENIFRVRLTRYKGHPVILSDGTEIKKNDLLLKIHFHNVKLLSEIHRFRNDFQKGNYFYHSIKASLPELATYINHHPKREEMKGLIGITSLHLEKNSLGFETVNIKNPLYRKIKQLMLFPIHLLSSEIYRKKEKKSIEPIYYFMSKSVLMEKYLPTEDLSSVRFEEGLPFN